MILGGKGGLRERSRTKKGTGWETKGRQGRGKGTEKPKTQNRQKPKTNKDPKHKTQKWPKPQKSPNPQQIKCLCWLRQSFM